jgi:hypothetical protein
MSLWKNTDANTSAPKGMASGFAATKVRPNSEILWANTQVGVHTDNQMVGVFGVDTTEQTLSATSGGNSGHPQHAGWVVRKVGTGPVVTITANSGAVAVNSFITFSQGNGISGSGNTAANARIFVNTAGYIMNVTVISGGEYANTPIATANTGNSALTVTVGGRAGRVQTETLVAMGSMTGDNDNIWGAPGA